MGGDFAHYARIAGGKRKEEPDARRAKHKGFKKVSAAENQRK